MSKKAAKAAFFLPKIDAPPYYPINFATDVTACTDKTANE